MSKRFIYTTTYLLIGFLGMFLAVAAFAKAEQTLITPHRLLVGTKVNPPFSMQTADGRWTGLSIDLWREIASELNIQFEFRELPLQQLLEGVEDRSLDAVVTALTITPEREAKLDFTHSFYTTGIGIAVASKTQNPWYHAIRQIFSLAFLQVAATLALVMATVGFLVWWFEHRKNPQHFDNNMLKGIGSGFWWTVVTLTTVGYGDKAPATFAGRILGIVWMFVGIVIVSSITATITSSLTVSQLQTIINGPEDLPQISVGALPETISATYLTQRHIPFSSYESPQEGLTALQNGEIQALVHDKAILQYYILKKYTDILEVLPHQLISEVYGIALQSGSQLREEIDVVLLEKIRGKGWQEKLKQYLGQ